MFEPGRIVELLEALEAMARDNQPIPPRAMILSRKYRTLVSSWIEPLQEEAELGYEIDYIARCGFLINTNPIICIKKININSLYHTVFPTWETSKEIFSNLNWLSIG